MSSIRTTRVHQHVRAPRAVVYRLLLDPSALARWKVPDGMTASVHTFQAAEGGEIRVSLTYDDNQAGGKSAAHTDTYSGRFIQLVQDERVIEVHSFETDDPALRGQMTSSIILSDAPNGGTDVTGIHEGVPPGISLADNETGWRMALRKLAALAESESGDSGAFYHGTRAELNPDDLIHPGYSSNYTTRRSPWVYFSETLNAATWGAELAKGEGRSRIYVVEPTGPFVDDPNLTNQRFPGNPTRSYRSGAPLRVMREHLGWEPHSPEEIQAMKDGIAGKEPIDD